MTDMVALARDVSTRAHEGQTDKVGRPYIEHPAAVTARLRTVDEQVVGWLHDVVEDSDITLAELRTMGFTTEQVLAVDAMTKRRREPLTDLMARVMADPIAPRVKRADVSHNADPARLALVLEEATRARLQAKYERTAGLLGTTSTRSSPSSGCGRDRRRVVATIGHPTNHRGQPPRLRLTVTVTGAATA